MDTKSPLSTTNRLWAAALALAGFTILYNLVEGIFATRFGSAQEELALFGFGLDSFIELISGAGIMMMVLRIWRHPGQLRGNFEQAALRVTGWGFYVLAGILVAGAVASVVSGHKPQPSLAGTVISLLSIAVMWALLAGKRHVGKALGSAAILADANCTMVCIYMSVVLLASSLLYTLTGFGWADALGSLGLAWFSLREGREAFETAAGIADGCACVVEHSPEPNAAD